MTEQLRTIQERVAAETRRAADRWRGVEYTDYVWCCILAEEVGEVARAVHDSHYARTDNWQRQLVEELVQVASVATRFAEWAEQQ